MKRWATASFVLAAATSLAWLVVPAYSTGATLIEVNGARVILPLTFPVLVALPPLIWPARRAAVVSASLLGAFVLLGGASIGLSYLPALASMIVAAWRS